ncbi:Transmembrane domain of uncharacterised function (DUF3566) [Rhodococcus rhodochrous]|uniref:DUF3566 domain-containing protein n=1 Tax=Rhodococcus TaxID=1827 RepID=UPI0007519EDB|nr:MULTISPECIES: DUF3566 domain-containing protein [Rhodococcus]MDO1483868.1 hypothetical protein [Rhodococcus rhodochrous]WSE22766.1 DUF3566 domain-containing protein [Rhodococcus sp. PD04]SNV07436.1 Transmembrane domain of uncharacterised function (DUF3566) [Rhodococcus rhodochrous]
MSTPQGPNGADRGQPGRKPEDRTENEVKPENKGTQQGPASEQKPAPENRPSQSSPTQPSQAPGTPAQGSSAPAAGAAADPAPAQGSADRTPAAGQKAAEPTAKAAQDKPARGDAPKSGGASADGGNGRSAAADQPATGQQRTAQMPRSGGPTPPWQRGAASAQSGSPQNAPQTNVPGVGPGLSKQGGTPQRPAAASAKGSETGGPAPSTRPVVTGTAAPKAAGGARPAGGGDSARGAGDRAAAAKAKSAVIDGPTRHIERKDLAKDLPDLSAVKHPSPGSPSTGETPQVSAPSTTAVPTASPAAGPLRATVQIRRIDPWSMLKISSVISVSLFFVWMIAVGLLYGVLAGMGVWERLNSAFTDIVSDAGSGALVSAGQVFGYATIIGIANTVLLTALATLGAFIYNLCTDLVGGVQATLADPD